jgi:hypothetical protein
VIEAIAERSAEQLRRIICFLAGLGLFTSELVDNIPGESLLIGAGALVTSVNWSVLRYANYRYIALSLIHGAERSEHSLS